MGKVIILTDIPAHRSVVGEAKCGIYVSSVNPTEIAKGIEYAYIRRKILRSGEKSGGKLLKKNIHGKKLLKDLENFLISVE